MIPITRNVERHRCDPPLNVTRLCPNVYFSGIELNSDDLLTEILLRLPVKSLSRFKCVCKKWLSIISDDYFCHQHTLRRPRPQPSLILQVNHRGELFYLDGGKKMIPYRDQSVCFSDCSILVACNGLMLLQFFNIGVNGSYLTNEGCYCVHNLTTRRSRKIALNRKNENPRLAGIGLAFDPSKSPYYKIVCVYPSYPKGDPYKFSYEIEVYDSESRSWKLGLKTTSVPMLYSTCGTHWNNKIYWWIGSHDGYCYFDIGKNEMKTLSLPETACPYPGLRVSNGHLYHCGSDESHCGDESTESVAVWEMVGSDDGPTSPWLLKDRALVYHNSYTSILEVLAGSDGDETCNLLTYSDRKIRVYSFRDQTHEDVIELTVTSQQCCQPKDGYYYVQSFQFGETLALV